MSETSRRMRSIFLTILTFLPLVAAASNLVGVSTLPGFLCADSQHSRCRILHHRPIFQSSLPSLLQHLSYGTTQSDLPLAETSTAPELAVVVTSRNIIDPSALIDRISAAIDGTSSFQASTDRDASESDLGELNSGMISSVDKLSAMASDDEVHLLENGLLEVVVVSAKEDDEPLFLTLRKLAERTAGKLAVVWTTREDVPEDAAAPDTPPGKENEQSVDEKTEPTDRKMNAPEINSAQLTGLLVALFFLIIFIPGFMCLWNIQPPQSFEIFDSNDMKKKMQ